MDMYLCQMEPTYLDAWLSASRFPLDIISNGSKYICVSGIKKREIFTYHIKANKNQEVTSVILLPWLVMALIISFSCCSTWGEELELPRLGWRGLWQENCKLCLFPTEVGAKLSLQHNFILHIIIFRRRYHSSKEQKLQ